MKMPFIIKNTNYIFRNKLKNYVPAWHVEHLKILKKKKNN